VEAFIKIVEFKHIFASIPYIRIDGLMAHYSPDFMVRTRECIYIVETKADKDITDGNVRQKQKATLGFIAQLNGLNPDMRDHKEWKYLLLSDAKFYMLSRNGATFEDIAKVSERTKSVVSGNLFES
jgi:type III restriction enzyme